MGHGSKNEAVDGPGLARHEQFCIVGEGVGSPLLEVPFQFVIVYGVQAEDDSFLHLSVHYSGCQFV